MIWLSSDFHFSHANIAGPSTSNWKSGYRDFKSVEEMNSTLLKTINKYVQHDDTLFYLGDFAFGGRSKIPSLRAQINCSTIHFIRGNHDHREKEWKDSFSSIQDYWQGKLEGYEFILSHYAFRVWYASHKGSFHCYGHSHGSLERTPYGKSMDVGVDNAYRLTGEYRPFSVDEIVKILEKREIEFPDHHSLETNVK